MLITQQAKILILLICAGCVTAQAAPKYQSDRAKELIEEMVEAHGGYTTWLNAPSMQFTALMYLAVLSVGDDRTVYDNWRYYTITVEPKSSRAYVDILFEPNQGPDVAYDGDQAWVVPYSFDVQRFRDGPVQLLWFHYGMVSLPFMTQVDGVKHEYIGEQTLLDDEQLYDVVSMSFEPQGKIHERSINLFIDKTNGRLKAWTQGPQLPLLPGNVLPDEFRLPGGGILRVIDEYVEVDGLLIARSYASFGDGNFGPEGSVTGAHLILDPSFSKPFDQTKLVKPTQAIDYPLWQPRRQN